jgi:hypothetical protein
MRTLQHGGQLEIGDFIAVSNGNHLDFGWYCGDGINTLQYYYYRNPQNAYNTYEDWLNQSEANRTAWKTKRYTNGFTKKCLWKSYINAVHTTRVLKINNPEEIFTNKEDRDDYEKSKETLIKLNFIK